MKHSLKKLLMFLCFALVVILAASLGLNKPNPGQAPETQALVVETMPTKPTEPKPMTEPAETQTPETQASETQETVEPETEAPETLAAETQGAEAALLDEDGYYYSKDEVALYIYQYGKLPANFISKKEAEKQGWKSGPLDKILPGMAIGGSRFGNNEGLLPEKKGRTYTECDIDTLGAKKRGSKRIVFSNDGLIYYTEDHYETFELLYGEE